MALHDVGKTDVNRLEPTPNAVDKQIQRMAHGTVGFTYKTEGDTNVPKLVIKDGAAKTINADGGLVFQTGVRESDASAAVDAAKPNTTLDNIGA